MGKYLKSQKIEYEKEASSNNRLRSIQSSDCQTTKISSCEGCCIREELRISFDILNYILKQLQENLMNDVLLFFLLNRSPRVVLFLNVISLPFFQKIKVWYWESKSFDPMKILASISKVWIAHFTIFWNFDLFPPRGRVYWLSMIVSGLHGSTIRDPFFNHIISSVVIRTRQS